MNTAEYMSLETGSHVRIPATNEFGTVVRLIGDASDHAIEICLTKTGNLVQKDYAEVQKLQLEYSADESQPETCPVCGGQSLDYGSFEVHDGCIEYPWVCEDCQTSGVEHGMIQFDGHELKDF